MVYQKQHQLVKLKKVAPVECMVNRVHQASRSARTLSFTWRRMMRRVSRKDTVLSEIQCLDEVGRVAPQADAPALRSALDTFSQWPFISDTVPSGRHSRSWF
ncbi:hypothetical protein T265_05146 [Opisthorchis viverrini]|uniref:Uncharacterized protein n=1 Tax=Opisthorchis viverrini TaxID=6198 RepID=A0A074ZKT1_OPIVI|nr:hypothetical protein T265_05146 [Opisthorchis viverrini]KER27948.1 hypothetical protein T265_05146 [Opisthorchis viverrini]